MYFDDTTDTVRLSAAELNAAIAAAASRGALAVTVADEGAGSPATAAAAQGGVESASAVLAEAAAVLADPVRTATMHAVIADASIRRLTVGWDCSGRCAVAARIGAEYAVQLRGPEELGVMLRALLGVDGPLSYAGLGVETSPRSALVALGFADSLRRERHQAVLAHVAASGSATAADVAACLADAAVEDFRWLLPFFDKVVPFEVAKLMDAPAVMAELDRLTSAGLLERNEGAAELPALYSPSVDGAALFDGLLHDVAKLAVTVFEVEAGKTVYESMLMVRDAAHLWVFDMTGERASIASAGPQAAIALCEALSGGPESPAETPAHAAPTPAPVATAPVTIPPPPPPGATPPPPAAVPPPPTPGAVACANCGEPVLPSSKFCMRCGTPTMKG